MINIKICVYQEEFTLSSPKTSCSTNTERRRLWLGHVTLKREFSTGLLSTNHSVLGHGTDNCLNFVIES